MSSCHKTNCANPKGNKELIYVLIIIWFVIIGMIIIGQINEREAKEALELCNKERLIFANLYAETQDTNITYDYINIDELDKYFTEEKEG